MIQKFPLNAKKAIALLVSLTMVFTMFASLSNLAVFADDGITSAVEDTAPADNAAEAPEQASQFVTPVKASLPAANEGAVHKHKIIVNAENLPAGDSEDNYEEIEFTPLYQADITSGKYAKAGQLPTQGNFYLAENITLGIQGSPVYGEENVANICFNGFTATAAAKARALSLSYIGSNNGSYYGWNQTMSFCDCSETQSGGLKAPAREYNANGEIVAILGNPDMDGNPTSATLNLYSGKISAEGTITASNGGCISISSTGIFNIFGGEIIGGTLDNSKAGQNGQNARYGGSVYTEGKVNMYGGVIRDGKCFKEATDKTAAAEHMGGNVGISGGAANACFTMYGGVIRDGVACDGGNIAVSTTTTTAERFVMYGGTVDHGHCDKQTYLKSGVSTATGANGGNMWFGGKARIEGGEILNGEALSDGGQIYMNQNGSNLTITGGYINKGKKGTNLTDNSSGSTISMPANAPKLTISGNPTILGGILASSANARVYVSGKPLINNGQGFFYGTNQYNNGNYTFADLEDGAWINVSVYYSSAWQQAPFVAFATADEAAANEKFFHSSYTSHSVIADGNTLKTIAGRYRCVCGENCEGVANDPTHVCKRVLWTGVSSLSATTTGYVYLTANVTLPTDTQVTFTAGTASEHHEIHIDLNGKTVTACSTKRVFSINNGYIDFSICDSVGTGKAVKTGTFDDSGAILFGGATTSTFDMYGGTLDCSALTSTKTNAGQVIHGSFPLRYYGGTVKGGTVNITTTGAATSSNYPCSSTSSQMASDSIAAGAIQITRDIKVYGGEIIGSKVTDNGPGWATGGSINCGNNFYMYGGTIKGGSVTQNGSGYAVSGNIYSRYGANFYGGSVENGTVTQNGTGFAYGGNIYNSSYINLDGATFIGGTINAGASANNAQGGSIRSTTYVILKNATVKGGTINSASKIAQGGNIFTLSYLQSDNSVISDGYIDGTASTAKGQGTGFGGGNVYTYTSATVRANSSIVRGVINGHTGAYVQGGGLYSRGKPTISDSHIDENSILSDGSVTAGTALGGNMYMYNVNGTATNSTFLNGIGKTGASIEIGWGSVGVTLDMTNCEVSGKQAYQGGAIAVWNGSILNATDCTFTGCEVDHMGGVIYMAADSEARTNYLTLTNTTVQGGKSGSVGGSIVANHTGKDTQFSEITLNAGTKVIGGESGSNGGNIFVAANTKLTVNDGAIISGGKVSSDSSAGKSGGNIYADAKSTLVINAARIENNPEEYAARQGGNIYINKDIASYKINGATVIGGYTSLQGGNIWLGAGSNEENDDFYIKNTAFYNGKSYGSGGNMFVYRQGYLEQVTFVAGTAQSGGNISIYRAGAETATSVTGLTLVGCSVENGTATDPNPDKSGFGGNIVNDTNAILNVINTNIIGGTSHRGFNGLYNGGIVNVSGTSEIEGFFNGTNAAGKLVVADDFTGSVVVEANDQFGYGLFGESALSVADNVTAESEDYEIVKEEVDGVAKLSIYAKASLEKVEQVKEEVFKDGEELTAIDILQNYSVLDNLNNQETALLKEENSDIDAIKAEAHDYKDMISVKYSVVKNDAGENVLIFFSAVDENARDYYDQASIVFINEATGTPKIMSTDQVYTSISDVNGDVYQCVDLSTGEKADAAPETFGNKGEMIYAFSMRVPNASLDKIYTIYASLETFDGVLVNGTAITVRLGDLVDAFSGEEE